MILTRGVTLSGFVLLICASGLLLLPTSRIYKDFTVLAVILPLVSSFSIELAFRRFPRSGRVEDNELLELFYLTISGVVLFYELVIASIFLRYMVPINTATPALLILLLKVLVLMSSFKKARLLQ